MPAFRLRFEPADIARWASRYDYPGEPALIEGPVARAQARGCLDYETFMEIGEWKSPRSRKRRSLNDPAFVEAVSRVALDRATPDRLSIEILTLLSGVDWPTASVILHFCHAERYPILDFRALWSLSVEVPPHAYRYPFWHEYVKFCRGLADRAGVDMRTLDRALWKYSEVHQKRTQRPGTDG